MRDKEKTKEQILKELKTLKDRLAELESAEIERSHADESLKLFSEAVENALDGIQIVGLDGHILYSNRAVEKIYGFSHEEYKGKHVNEMNADPEFASKVILPSIMETGQWAGEIMVKHKDGGVFPIWLTASIVKNNMGEPIATVGIITDITERKRIEQVLLESKERYRNLFENSPISLWEEDCSDIKKYIDNLKSKGIKDLRAYFDKYPKEVALCANMVKVVDVNKATIDLFKAKSKGDFITGLENIFTENSYEVFKEELIAIAEGKSYFESEDIVKTMTGDKIYITMKWVLTLGNEKAYSKRLVSIVDITERKRAEEAIKKYAKQLEESNRMKELFTDIMHHDLLNPLNISKNYIDILREGEAAPKKISSLEIIERNLTKGMELIENATMLSKLESLESISFGDMDLKEVIEKVIENLCSLVDKSGMKLENNISVKMPVRANRIIEEVFVNLITNAVKYASNGKKILVGGEDAKECWRVKIIDFGEGIDDSDKTTIFERFHRGGKKGVKGSGLGLAIARKIMELHKGRIWVEDNPEGGAVVVVEIPKDPVFKYGE